MKVRIPSLFDLFSALSLPQWVLAGGMILGVGGVFPPTLYAQIDEIEEEDFEEMEAEDDLEMDLEGDEEPPFDLELIRPAVRSLGVSPNHPVDNRDRPHYRERATHQGYEVVNDQFTVFAKSSMEDARATAREVASAWGDMSAIADRFTRLHRRPNFAVGAFTVIIDTAAPDSRRNAGKSTTIGGNQPVIYVNIGEGQPSLREQTTSIRRATSEMFFGTTQLNKTLPAWVQSGMSDYVAKLPKTRQPGAVAPPGAAFPPAIDTGDNNPTRATPDQLAADPNAAPDEQRNASLWVRYLMEGDDARHAPAFFAALVAAQEESDGTPPARIERARSKPNGEEEFADEGNENDDLINLLSAGASATGGIAEWMQEPNVDLPLVPAGKDGKTPVLNQRQQEMLVILKLARRFEKATNGGVKPRVTEFGAAGQREVAASSASSIGGDLSTLLDRLREGTEPWATLDTSGKPLFSDEGNRLEELFGVGENRYSTEVKAGKLLLSTRVDASTTVTAWLEENPQQPRRPIARFQVDSLNRATNPGAIPPTTSSDETEGTPANVPAATPDPIRSGYRVPSVAPQLPPTFRR